MKTGKISLFKFGIQLRIPQMKLEKFEALLSVGVTCSNLSGQLRRRVQSTNKTLVFGYMNDLLF